MISFSIQESADPGKEKGPQRFPFAANHKIDWEVGIFVEAYRIDGRILAT